MLLPKFLSEILELFLYISLYDISQMDRCKFISIWRIFYKIDQVYM